jgi:hypothetical protein
VKILDYICRVNLLRNPHVDLIRSVHPRFEPRTMTLL